MMRTHLKAVRPKLSSPSVLFRQFRGQICLAGRRHKRVTLTRATRRSSGAARTSKTVRTWPSPWCRSIPEITDEKTRTSRVKFSGWVMPTTSSTPESLHCSFAQRKMPIQGGCSLTH